MPIFTVIIESFFKLLLSHYPSSIISNLLFSLQMAEANTALGEGWGKGKEEEKEGGKGWQF